MDKKPILLVLLLTLVIIVAYVGIIASIPAVTPSTSAAGEVKLEVTGLAATSSTQGIVSLVVV